MCTFKAIAREDPVLAEFVENAASSPRTPPVRGELALFSTPAYVPREDQVALLSTPAYVPREALATTLRRWASLPTLS